VIPRLAAALAVTILGVGCPGDDDGMPPDAGVVDADSDESFHDPLSRPAEPTLSPMDFTRASVCGTCHINHFEQWRSSMHAYAMTDPVFRALVAARREDYPEQDQFCTQCHTAIGTRGGSIVDGFSFSALPDVVLEGVTCDGCHKVSGMERLFNSGHVYDPDGPMRSTIEDPVASPAHASEYSPLHGTAEFCAGCHDVIEMSGVELERPYEEWLESPAGEAGRPCQSCHMPTYTGRAAPGAPERELHSHRFVGVDVPLTDGFGSPEDVETVRTEVVALLGTAAGLELSVAPEVIAGQQLDLVVTIENRIDAHNLPTGSTFIRQVWLEVVVTDAAGEVIYETGTLDDNGDLRDVFSEIDPFGDDDLIVLGSSLVDADGQPVIFPWRAAEHVLRAIPPLLSRTATLFVPTAPTTTGPLTVATRLRFRTHPPYLLRRLGLPSLVDRIEIYDLATATATVAVTP
jgi:hypothetical protein